MQTWLLLVFLLVVWGLSVMASASQVSVEDTKRGTPKESRRGVSILPTFPLIPLLFWALALLVNHWFVHWGTIIVGGFHLLLIPLFIVTIVRAALFIRSQDVKN